MPEMALIGYKFESREEVAPYVEPLTDDPSQVTDDMHTLKYCLDVSTRYKAWVACGLAEISGDKFYNTLILVNAE